jgi:PleD family two-component response regulator
MLANPPEHQGSAVRISPGCGTNSDRSSASQVKKVDTQIKSIHVPLIPPADNYLSVKRSIRRLLHSAGFRVEDFASADQFLASERDKNSCCLILDQRMPRMNCLQLQRRLAE